MPGQSLGDLGVNTAAGQVRDERVPEDGNVHYNARCDSNGDGAVDVVDLLGLVYNFGT
jgi:hypothetical protein